MTFRVLTWNLWHGLNPYQRLLMRPMESPIARRRRRRRQIEVLSGWKQSPQDIICLQEVNPFSRQIKKISNGLALHGDGCIVNAGVKIARFGLPPFLEEGLATFAGEGFSPRQWAETTLSGSAREYPGLLGISLTVQLAERRKALLFEAQCGTKRIAVVNLHLHHGPDTVRQNLARKAAELLKLKQWLEPRAKDWDFLAVCGDFNCDPQSSCLEPLESLGLKDTSQIARAEPFLTWNPQKNPLAGMSPELAGSEEVRAWDAGAHSFDRIYIRSVTPVEKVALSMICEPELSDHFGLAAEISFGS